MYRGTFSFLAPVLSEGLLLSVFALFFLFSHFFPPFLGIPVSNEEGDFASSGKRVK